LLVFALRHQRLVRTRSAGIDPASLVPRSPVERTVGFVEVLARRAPK